MTPEQRTCQVTGGERTPGWDGRYALVGQVKPGDIATHDLSHCRTPRDGLDREAEVHSARKGNDVVAIDPPGQTCPLFQREHY